MCEKVFNENNDIDSDVLLLLVLWVRSFQFGKWLKIYI